MKIKICGITNIEDGKRAESLGVDELGFNFYRQSKRYVLPEVAAEISKAVDVETVGVFVNESPEKIAHITTQCHLNAVQLHGNETQREIAIVRQLTGRKIIRAMGVDSEFTGDQLREVSADAVLLDRHDEKDFGGTGLTFDWSRVDLSQDGVRELYIAGGLSPENVAEAVRRFRPDAVDVCSGVEAEAGRKDFELVKSFVTNARRAQEELRL